MPRAATSAGSRRRSWGGGRRRRCRRWPPKAWAPRATAFVRRSSWRRSAAGGTVGSSRSTTRCSGPRIPHIGRRALSGGRCSRSSRGRASSLWPSGVWALTPRPTTSSSAARTTSSPTTTFSRGSSGTRHGTSFTSRRPPCHRPLTRTTPGARRRLSSSGTSSCGRSSRWPCGASAAWAVASSWNAVTRTSRGSRPTSPRASSA
mmetsp:Transcript_98714/g.284860  ORF Transcript_98714/g.284860 Transcript_98714/m.284860 type:complete len:204 (+) Transcript_98714:1515-2126(+)